MRVAIMQGPDGLTAGSSAWAGLEAAIQAVRPQVLVTNEMPFGPWLAQDNMFDEAAAATSLATHDSGVEILQKLEVPIVLSSRPVRCGGRLANEAFALISEKYHFAHQKHYFPDEPGWYETAWFQTGRPGFDVVDVGGLKVGFLLCTELFFNEWARHYGRLGATLIAVPRASGESVGHWLTAASMAAIVSGCYVVSSNRIANATFGGRGFAVGPDGSLIAETSHSHPVVAFDVDPDRSAQQRTQYPCYVKELVATQEM
jgi:predicted amidohydrolase